MNTPVSSLLTKKSIELLSVAPDTTVQKAVELMNRVRVGSVLVMDSKSLVGIFTERDVLRKIVAEGRDATKVAVSEVMSSQLVTISPDTEVGQAMDIVSENKVRHLPVLEDGLVVGLISAGDLNRHATETFRAEAGTLMSYLSDSGGIGY
ncbi:CBS domain-containing protein [Pelagicoccus mobilis]|uniref:CBS domain-containing protein n=1 Tax=Pelagicoccus mobilis TaxID=415221 RepID=A0A934RZQ3_9BACT|nr:CBS domain-containing protein [Pelagicoccus mobilis]MBK1879611.1 CBS domain-containing protein [Pelagicoccus mobilis]